MEQKSQPESWNHSTHTHSIKNRSKGRGIFMLPLFCMIIGPRRTINNDRTSKIKCYNHFTLIFTVTHFWQVNHRNRLTKKRFVIDLMSFKFQPNPFAWTPGLQVSGETSNLFFKKIQSVFSRTKYFFFFGCVENDILKLHRFACLSAAQILPFYKVTFIVLRNFGKRKLVHFQWIFMFDAIAKQYGS